MSDYLTVAEFAAAAGVTKQAVYKRLASDLAQHSRTIDGKRVIDRAALDLFSPHVESCQPRQGETDKDREIERQREEIQDLRQQVKSLQAHVMTQATELTRLTGSLTEILSKQGQLQENFQVLLGQHQKMLEGLSPSFKEPGPVSTGDNQVEQSVYTQETVQDKENNSNFDNQVEQLVYKRVETVETPDSPQGTGVETSGTPRRSPQLEKKKPGFFARLRGHNR